MDKGTLANKNGSPTYVHNVASSRFFDSFQRMIHSAEADCPFMDRRHLLEESLGSDKQTRGRLFCDELVSSARNRSSQNSGQNRTHERKLRTVACEGGNSGGREGPNLTLPFFVYTKSTDSSSSAKIRDFAGEIAVFESAAQAVSSKDNRENNFKTTFGRRGESKDEPEEKRRKKEYLEDDDANNGTRESEGYWERRKKNNASAKKSRDARKARELQTQIKADFLERENLRILAQLMIVQQENACLKRVLCAKM